MRQTLADMAASEKTTFVAVLYGGAALVDGACEAIGGYVVAKWKMVSAIGVVFALVQGTLIIDPVTTTTIYNASMKYHCKDLYDKILQIPYNENFLAISF